MLKVFKSNMTFFFFLVRRDERRPFTDRSLYTADSEDEDDRTRSKKTAVKVEDQPSGFEGEGNADAQKPLNSKIVSESYPLNILMISVRV